ncbi:2-oxoglutarate dehydrogenase E1 component [Chlamydia trachomatis]|nr:2-oxoglutarate dehydrogenase E1 component [Chlamydia trachomatis]
MGAFSYFALATDEIFPSKLQCVCRPRSSSTATGSASLSQKELSTLMETLFSIGRE